MFAPFSRCVRSVLLLAAAWGASVSFAAAIQPANPAAPPPAGVLIDPGWPRTYQTQTGTVVCFQPQIDEWKDGRVAGRMAVGAQLAGAGEPVFGALWFTGSTVADQKLRVAQIYDIAVARTSFPPGAPNVAAIDQAVRSVVPSNVRHLDLDRLLANLARTKRARRSGAAKLSNSTPKIVVVHQPGVLVPLFGDPVLQTIPAAGLQAVINTPADLLLDPKSGRVYLATADAWLVSNDLLAGPWDWATAPPPGLDQIPANDPRSAAKQVGVHAGTDKAPLVVVSTKPTELIALDGEPVLVPLENTKLMFAANTPNDVFVSTVDRKWYVLLSGRWFTSASLDDGPWLHVPSTQLPADFSQIPPTSPKANVLPSVAGTLAAQEALLADTIPQFAAVARESAQLKVTYDGPPNFAAIPRTNLTYATNTAFDVIGADGAFYCCYQAVWFTAVDPLGPWTLADAVPEEIYEIPASHPLFHDTFVEVYDSSPAEIVYGYLPGYLGSYPDNGVIVYGTGYNHSPYLNRDRGVFFGWPVTWGGAWRYNPFFNGFGYRAGWYTPYQHGFVRAGWNPTAGWAGATLERYTPYGHWGESVVRHGESWVRTAGA
ncbi:MAG TPA: hypothetical protein VGE52_02360, partial [Pirellulales bacterium]